MEERRDDDEIEGKGISSRYWKSGLFMHAVKKLLQVVLELDCRIVRVDSLSYSFLLLKGPRAQEIVLECGSFEQLKIYNYQPSSTSKLTSLRTLFCGREGYAKETDSARTKPHSYNKIVDKNKTKR